MRIYVKVIPRAGQNKIEKISEGEYKVRLTAPPVDGEANKLLVEILSDYFDIPKSLIAIVGGQSARTKIVDLQK